jgi:hypothetical protein
MARTRREALLSDAVAHLQRLRYPDRAGALRAIADGLRARP